MRCFADFGNGRSALNIKKCEGCAFFKTVEQKIKDDEKTRNRLHAMKSKGINIFN